MTKKSNYNRLTVEGDIQTKWICGCFETVDGFFKFCTQHSELMRNTIVAQIDKLDMTTVVEEK
ncbi:MAG: hypothetical protein KGH87_04040 [Thaumarchaeota archaeon]|nr:hypothetical protein [Nitrososphaerota archaeon]MDE1839071.1 hypothetical protein [Nitrososphaerota archaeon]